MCAELDYVLDFCEAKFEKPALIIQCTRALDCEQAKLKTNVKHGCNVLLSLIKWSKGKKFRECDR